METSRPDRDRSDAVVAESGAREAVETPRDRWAALSGSARDAGMATAEYAIATVAAAGFAGLLIAVLRSSEVRSALAGIVRQALQV